MKKQPRFSSLRRSDISQPYYLLPCNIGGTLCSTPQSLADAQYWSAVQ